MMQQCWRRYASDRPHFDHIVNTLTAFLDRLKRPDSIYNSDSESDEDPEGNHMRHGSGKLPARTPSIRSGKGTYDQGRGTIMVKIQNPSLLLVSYPYLLAYDFHVNTRVDQKSFPEASTTLIRLICHHICCQSKHKALIISQFVASKGKLTQTSVHYKTT